MPDNITPPLAACLGDLLTLFILALLGTVLVGAMDTPLPLMAVIMMTIAAGWFSRRVLRNRWVKEVATGGWIPLVSCQSCVHVNVWEYILTMCSDRRNAHLKWNWYGTG